MLRSFTWLCTFLFILALSGGIGTLAVLYYFGRGLPDYAQLAKYEPPVVSRLYASDGRLFAEYATQKRVFVPIEAIPQRVVQTILAAEDKNFYEHPGLDFFGIIRAAVVNFSQRGTNKRPMGASTITQQVAKNLLLSSIANQASYERKIKEAILAFRIENALSKDRILEIYINEIYLGSGSYGVAAAALNYFNKSLDELTIAEAAFLAGLPKAPSKYNPKQNYAAAKARRDWVITRMYEERIITRKEALEAKAEPIEIRRPNPTHVVKADYFAEEVRRKLIAKHGEPSLYQGGLTVRTTLDPQLQKIADWALRKGLIDYDRLHGWRGALQHIDLKDTSPEAWKSQLAEILQPPGAEPWTLAIVLKLNDKEAKIGLKSGEEGTIPLSELTWARQHKTPVKPKSDEIILPQLYLGPVINYPSDVLKVGDVILVNKIEGKENKYTLEQIPAVGGALVALDPQTGRVLAMTGGFSFEASQFNRATQALRQPGSAIKPFVYLAAMERGFSPGTIVSDAPITIALGRGLGIYAPKNVTTRHYGKVPLRVALQKSLNRTTIRLVHEYVGMRPVAKVIEKFGIMDRVPMQIAMAIGAGETTLLRLATAYGMLANGGKKLEATLIDRIQDRHGKTIFAADTRQCSHCKSQLWTNQNPPLIEDHREQLADPRSIYQITSMLEGAVRAGSARKAKVLNKILAAKTGTTNDEKEAWTAAYTDRLVVVTYVGFDHPQTLGHMEGGARSALPIIVDFLGKALDGVPSKPFKIPPGMKLVRMMEPGSGDVIYEALKANQSLPKRLSAPSYGYDSGSQKPYGKSTYDSSYPSTGSQPRYGSETSYDSQPLYDSQPSYGSEVSYDNEPSSPLDPSYGPEAPYHPEPSYAPPSSHGSRHSGHESSYSPEPSYESQPDYDPHWSSDIGTGGLY
ncbi:MAG TPA: PBP1A family penicillin-binding protein [Alphaproteobacteria bacterium]|nr:PBP1A family penicillin-binding protein [Alphaproteobacteria bacterium]